MIESFDNGFSRQRRFVDAAASVLFFAQADGGPMPCYVTRLALVQHFGADERLRGPDGVSDCLRAFDASVGRIGQVARDCIRSRQGQGRAVVITSRDVLRSVADVE